MPNHFVLSLEALPTLAPIASLDRTIVRPIRIVCIRMRAKKQLVRAFYASKVGFLASKGTVCGTGLHCSLGADT